MPNYKMYKKSPIALTLRSSLGALLAAFAVACGATPEESQSVDQASIDDPLAAIVAQNLTALATQCQFNTTTGVMTVAVATGETAIISKRVADSAIVQNGWGCNNAATAGTVKKITVTGSAGDETVIVDFTNGVFSTGTASATSGIAVDMGGSTGTDVFAVRGTTGADSWAMGTLGIAVNADAFKDISFVTQPDSYTVSLGDGNDTWTAGGGSGLGVGTTYVGAKPITL